MEGGALDSDLLTRLREALGDRAVTEAELRSLVAQADGWARTVRGQVEASERRLARLAANPTTPLAELARELRRVELLLPALTDAEDLLAALEARARRERTAWLLRQAGAAPDGDAVAG